MKAWSLVLVLALVQVILPVATEDSVIELTSKDADESLATGTWLVEFYAPWCGFCQRLEPTYAAAATELSSQGVKVAKIDGTQNQALSARFEIQGFPTIFHIHDGEVRSFEGERSQEGLVAFATTGWKDQEPSFSNLMAPMGLLKRAMGTLVELAVSLQGAYDHMRDAYGFSQPVAIGVSLVATILVGSVLGFLLSLLFPHPAARAKRD